VGSPGAGAGCARVAAGGPSQEAVTIARAARLLACTLTLAGTLGFVVAGGAMSAAEHRRARQEPEPAPVVPVVPSARLCPVAGSVTFTDTYGAARPGGRTHKGVDLFAPAGTPVVAPADGQVTHFEDGLGGLSFGLLADDGTFHYGTHLSSYENAGIGRVTAGTLVGRVGNTGNAVTTPPHLHWQIHPAGRGTPTMNPTPTARAVCAPTEAPVVDGE
jgi:murein DD-endopeptidase MepM/ murein hydrolase activator NlpD